MLQGEPVAPQHGLRNISEALMLRYRLKIKILAKLLTFTIIGDNICLTG